MVVEVMGRNTGWIATFAGLAGGADVILIPEKPFDLDEVCELLIKRHMRGKKFSIVVVAEGARIAEGIEGDGKLITQEKRVDEFGHVRLGGIAQVIASEIEKKTGYETRFVVLGHIQRGGSPTPYDRVLATRFGIFATEMVNKGEFGKMAALSGDSIVAVPLEEAVAKTKTVNMEIFKISEEFFG
jgi:6-phosphofructokinase 1